MIDTIPYDYFGDSQLDLKPAMHFCHANGYPPLAYRPLFKSMVDRFNIWAMRMRPLWPGAEPLSIMDWRPLANDLAGFLDEQGLDSIIGVGHSMGATTTLRLALRQPDRFSAIILIDPVIFPPVFTGIWSFLSRFGFSYPLSPLISRTLNRRNNFDKLTTMFSNYRNKLVFAKMDDDALMAYCDSLACIQADGSLRLCYSPEWEARIYITGIRADQEIWRNLKYLKPPLLLIRGAESDTFFNRTALLFQGRLSSVQIETIPNATHLVPLEYPELVSTSIREFLTYTQNL